MNRAFNRKKDKSWMHTPEALAKHFIAYNAKFLGHTEVDQPKGTEVVRDAVRKLKFQKHIKKSEGQKIPKMELQISIYGVKILDPKSKEVQHNCQLHRISFCADDKTDKRIFTFICKDSESNKHLCYVFDSEKCAEEITLTIGQAFDLAYKKFLESGGKDVETRKQIGGLQKRIQDLEAENSELKKQLQVLEEQLMIAQVPPGNSISSKTPTDIFDMVPFSPMTPLVPLPASNGSAPPPPARPTEIRGVQNGTNSRGHCLFPRSTRRSLLMPRRKFCHFHVKPFVLKCQTRVYSQDVNVFTYIFFYVFAF
uniref:PTB domain-containing engulfment adapter protein 1 n=1 Tax=Cyprinus carpio TaxID=7962 RepID=A0A8C1ITV0_CYPCA